MTRLTLVLALCAAFAAPASAFSTSVSLPTLTFPPAPMPDVTQPCGTVAAPVAETCTAPLK